MNKQKIIMILSYLTPYIFILKIRNFFRLIVSFSKKRYYSKKFKKMGNEVRIFSKAEIKGEHNISIGDRVKIGDYSKIEVWENHNGYTFNPEIIIGDDVSIGEYCHISAVDYIEIRNAVLIAGKVYISDHAHGESTKESMSIPPNKRKLYSKGPILIEENVWIGENVSILPGVKIGKGTIVGANSVVTHSMPAYSICCGCPARIIKELGDQVYE